MRDGVFCITRQLHASVDVETGILKYISTSKKPTSYTVYWREGCRIQTQASTTLISTLRMHSIA
jgi:hypothetical protein